MSLEQARSMSYLAALYSPVRGLSRLSGLLAKSGVSAQRVGEVLTCTDRVTDRSDARPAPAVIDEVRERRLSAAPLSDPDLRLDFLLVQTKDRPLSVASRHFLQSLKKALTRISRPWPDAVEQRRHVGQAALD